VQNRPAFLTQLVPERLLYLIPKQESLLEPRGASRRKEDVASAAIHIGYLDEALSLYRSEVAGQCRSLQTEEVRETMQWDSSGDTSRHQDRKLRAS